MCYLTIRTDEGRPARRVDLVQFAGLFAVPETPPPARPRRRAARYSAAPLLLAALFANVALLAPPATSPAAPRSASAAIPS